MLNASRGDTAPSLEFCDLFHGLNYYAKRCCTRPTIAAFRPELRIMSVSRTLCLLLLAGGLTACGSGPQEEPLAVPTGDALRDCGADQVQWALGERYTRSLARRIQDQTDAPIVRPIQPEGVNSMDHLSTRINLRLGETNRVRRVSCG